jgi:hypothetical protein
MPDRRSARASAVSRMEGDNGADDEAGVVAWEIRTSPWRSGAGLSNTEVSGLTRAEASPAGRTLESGLETLVGGLLDCCPRHVEDVITGVDRVASGLARTLEAGVERAGGAGSGDGPASPAGPGGPAPSLPALPASPSPTGSSSAGGGPSGNGVDKQPIKELAVLAAAVLLALRGGGAVSRPSHEDFTPASFIRPVAERPG